MYLIDTNGKVTRDEVRVESFIAKYKDMLTHNRED